MQVIVREVGIFFLSLKKFLHGGVNLKHTYVLYYNNILIRKMNHDSGFVVKSIRLRFLRVFIAGVALRGLFVVDDGCQSLAVQEHLFPQVVNLRRQEAEGENLYTAQGKEDHQGDQGSVGIEHGTQVENEDIDTQADSDQGKEDADETEQQTGPFEDGKEYMRESGGPESKL